MKGKESKPHIGIFGRRNVGKSSLINTLVNQDIAIVSGYAGTTTDPVKKSIEIPKIGPSIIIDTAGIDDEGELGLKRIEKSIDTIKTIDIALLVVTENTFSEFETKLIEEFKRYDTPYIIIHNKTDLEKAQESFIKNIRKKTNKDVVSFSTKNPYNLEELINLVSKEIPQLAYQKPSLLGDIINEGDIVLLITPIDIEAPEGRIILPQIQAIRDILDNNCVAIVLKEREVDAFLRKTNIKPKLAVTDSQIFNKADASVPHDVLLTSFSILLARFKANFEAYLQGTPHISKLKDGDRILLLESCTHHVSCDDIGRVKIPRWISQFTGKELFYDVVAGLDKLSRDMEEYALVIQCGGCVVTQKQLQSRLKDAIDKNIPVTNYGMAIAYVQGIYQRAVEPFVKESYDLL